MSHYTVRGARSGSLLVGLGAAIVVETLVLHLWLGARHPAWAWALTIGSLAAIGWLALDYRALGAGGVVVDAREISLTIGRRAQVRIPRETVSAATRPGWRDLPVRGTPEGADYLDLTRPAEPNVLLALSAPARVRLAGGLRREARRLALQLDAPEEFVAELSGASADARPAIARLS